MKTLASIRPELYMILMHLYNIQEIIHYNKDKISKEDADMINEFEKNVKELKNRI